MGLESDRTETRRVGANLRAGVVDLCWACTKLGCPFTVPHLPRRVNRFVVVSLGRQCSQIFHLTKQTAKSLLLFEKTISTGVEVRAAWL